MSELDTILIVDDDAAIRHATALRLSASGYTTFTANDGEEGFAVAKLRRPNAIIMDVHMPNLDGISALRKLRCDSETANIPVVMLSASSDVESEALDEGAQFYIQKPYSKEILLAAVSAALPERKANDES